MSEKNNIHEGDYVRIKSWSKMAAENGVKKSKTPFIQLKGGTFSKRQKFLCGMTGRVLHIHKQIVEIDLDRKNSKLRNGRKIPAIVLQMLERIDAPEQSIKPVATPRHSISVENRKQVFAKTNGHCAYCGTPLSFKEMEVDHVIPLALGGADSLENWVPACHVCNQFKGHSRLEEFRAAIEHITDVFSKSVINSSVALKYQQAIFSPHSVTFYFETLRKNVIKESAEKRLQRAIQDMHGSCICCIHNNEISKAKGKECKECEYRVGASFQNHKKLADNWKWKY